jgi:hypothetical protein
MEDKQYSTLLAFEVHARKRRSSFRLPNSKFAQLPLGSSPPHVTHTSSGPQPEPEGLPLLPGRAPRSRQISGDAIEPSACRSAVRCSIDPRAEPSYTSSPHAPDAFANGTSACRWLSDTFASWTHGRAADYVDEMYKLWKSDPKAVHASWDVYFSGMQQGMRSEDAFRPPPNIVSMPTPVGGAPTMSFSGNTVLEDHMKVCCGRHATCMC